MVDTLEMGFHRKYRPKKLSEYIGNSKLKESVRKALNSVHKPQVILLKGPAGTGKTTMARLLAKEYLCEDRSEDLGACDKCITCQAMNSFIESGRSDVLTNIREVDVTDSNKKQDIDDLIEDASMPSFDGNWKVYILDECHMMTPSAQNRLLKTLEEPPERVLIILCTTNPEKMLDTILSRCQYIFSVQKPNKDELCALLQRVCKLEGVLWERRAFTLICAKGDFVPRKVLVSLEQVVREAKEVTYDNTVKVLSMVADKYYFEFFSILLEPFVNTQKYISFLGKLKSDMELSSFMDSIIPFTMRGIYVSNSVVVEALDISEIDQYKKLFRKFNVTDLAYLLEVLVDIKQSADVEAKLMLLGFKGLHKPVEKPATNLTSVELIDNTQYSAAEEQKAGEQNYLESVTVTEEEKLEKIEDYQKPLSIEVIAATFGGSVILDEGSVE